MDIQEIKKLYTAANNIVEVMDKVNLKGAHYRELDKCFSILTSILIDQVGEVELIENVAPPTE